MPYLSLDWMPHFLPMVTMLMVAAFTPGPNNIMLAASGANFGFRRTLPHMAGVTAGFVALMWMTGLGLDWIFGFSPLVQQGFRVLALCFIFWLAWRIANSTIEAKKAGGSRPQYFIEAAAFQFINPKALTVVVTIIASFVSPDADFTPQLATMLASAALLTIAAVAVWSGFGTIISRFINTPLRLMVFNYTMAVLLLLSMLPVFLDMVG